MSNVFDIDTSPETPELLELARVQLRETPEIKEKAFKELRELLKKNSDLNYRDDDAFLQMILRPCHWYPEGAIKLLRQIAEFRKENAKFVKGLLPEQEKKAFCEGNVINILTGKDQLGRRVLIVNQGKLWNPDEVTADQLFKLFYMIHIVAMQEFATQINGVVVIMDFEGLSLKQVKALSPGSTKRLLTFIQDAMPLRLKEVHFVKQPFIFNMVWTLIKPFVKEKLKQRMFFHGDDMKKLHKHIPADYLPTNYGGTLPAIDYSGKDWYGVTERYVQEFEQWNTYGFK
ncbi:CLUMA_CG003865, isoform A [Clunio marinus]|uniref:CLUMA_CG003865, isoform A n=1 Tax=Clunio marinus TaxID=568069 RepID=A0A1J1HQ32_9DIPT|nr:CLUMA_CG003865, isoform A [Clunio marinus]